MLRVSVQPTDTIPGSSMLLVACDVSLDSWAHSLCLKIRSFLVSVGFHLLSYGYSNFLFGHTYLSISRWAEFWPNAGPIELVLRPSELNLRYRRLEFGFLERKFSIEIHITVSIATQGESLLDILSDLFAQACRSVRLETFNSVCSPLRLLLWWATLGRVF